MGEKAVRNVEVLRKIGKKYIRVRKRWLNFLEHIMWKNGLEKNGIHKACQSRDIRKDNEITYLTSFCKWVTVKGMDEILKRKTLLGDTKDSTLGRAMIIHVPN